LRDKVQDIQEVARKLEDSEFLKNNIPGLDNMIIKKRDNIIGIFQRFEYPLPKMSLTTMEGEIPCDKSKICIIKQGECKIFSSRVPVVMNEQSKMSKKRKKVHIASKNGYFSDTINSLQICNVGRGHWIGDEALVMGEGVPYPFSVITNSRVIVYETTVEKFKLNLPKDTIYALLKNCKKKLRFLEDRVKNICRSVSEVAKWDNYYNEYTERVTEVTQMFSKASK
jgi:hypothetical protein